MNIQKLFLKSKVARRIFFLFIFCALLPLFIIAGITYTSVSSQLTRQANARLRQSCKIKGEEIYNKFFSLEMELKMAASIARTWTKNTDISDTFIAFKDELQKHFKGIAVVTNQVQKIEQLKKEIHIPQIP